MDIAYSKLRKLEKEELKEGMIVVGSPYAYSCWRSDKGIVPFKIKDISSLGVKKIDITTGKESSCSCGSFDNLYLYEEPQKNYRDAQRLFNEAMLENERMNDKFEEAIWTLNQKIDNLEKMMLEGDKLEEENKKMWKKFNQ